MTESDEQELLFDRAKLDKRCKLMHAVPNDGKRTWHEGAKFKRRGLKAGVPDIALPVPSPNGFHGLYIELKRKHKPNRITLCQAEWIYELNQAGNYACVCYGWEIAWQTIQDYLAGNIAVSSSEIIRK